jgi:hypothetical protein
LRPRVSSSRRRSLLRQADLRGANSRSVRGRTIRREALGVELEEAATAGESVDESAGPLFFPEEVETCGQRLDGVELGESAKMLGIGGQQPREPAGRRVRTISPGRARKASGGPEPVPRAIHGEQPSAQCLRTIGEAERVPRVGVEDEASGAPRSARSGAGEPPVQQSPSGARLGMVVPDALQIERHLAVRRRAGQRTGRSRGPSS